MPISNEIFETYRIQERVKEQNKDYYEGRTRKEKEAHTKDADTTESHLGEASEAGESYWEETGSGTQDLKNWSLSNDAM